MASSRVSRTTDRINAQIQIDTAEGTTGTSSSSSQTSRRPTNTNRNSSAYEEARTSTPDATATAIARRTRSQSLRPTDDTNINLLRPTISHRSDSDDTDSDDNAGNNIKSFAALSVMTRQQLGSTYDQQQRQFRKRIASESTTMYVASNQPRVLRLPLEFSSNDTTDNDAYTYAITQPQSDSTPPTPSLPERSSVHRDNNDSPSPTHDAHRG